MLTASRQSTDVGSTTKEASSPNSPPPPETREGKQRMSALRRTGSSGGDALRWSPGSQSRCACVEASTRGFLRGRLSTMAAMATGAEKRKHMREAT